MKQEGLGMPLGTKGALLFLGTEILVVPREKTPTGAAARGNPGDAPVLAS